MRALRFTALAIVASFALAACSSPTVANDECVEHPQACAGFPTSGN